MASKFLDASDIGRGIAEVGELAILSGVRIALAGGAAMQLLGSDRLTKDVDFVANGIVPLARPKKLPFGGVSGKTAGGVPVDVIVRDDDYQALYQAAVRTAQRRASVSMLVVRPEYLVAMKMVAARPKDEQDLMFLLTSPHVDLAKAKQVVRADLGAFAADELDRLIDEAQWQATRRKSKTRRRSPK